MESSSSGMPPILPSVLGGRETADLIGAVGGGARGMENPAGMGMIPHHRPAVLTGR
ncbi:hypothetical protein Sm713_62510 [Streptomyces sp. TS71-3]|nr:hypothetical protein Sm713_62510 [Streptomyces sp. TS71-3]